MSSNNKNLHLTVQERIIIEKGIENGSTKAAIALTIGKDKSTVGKGIKKHRELVHKSSYKINCANMKNCSHNHVCDNCADFKPFTCNRRDRSPGACNGCSKYTHCRYDKYRYKADFSHKKYREDLVDSRTGINMSYEECKAMADIIVPLIKAGHSPYHIVTNHPELNISEKTLYNYIENGIFREFGLLDIDLRIKTKRKITKKASNKYKKREDKKYLNGRTYDDFINYTAENKNLSVVEMDTVYNNGSTGPFMQTFKFLDYSFMFIVYQEEKTAKSMVEGVDLLEKILGEDLFSEEVAIIKTDRGSEFCDAEGFEKEENESRRTRIFYCDPMASGQKGSLENNHKEIRYICPKENDLKDLGLNSQEKANLIVSHINSQSKEHLKGKSPLEVMEFMNPALYQKFKDFGIERINKDNIVLKPYLLKD
ncbi:MAG: transposase [Faecalibacillus intestinalis]|uniref:helix-turn-helix domain-containing protein n=1 Tax=Faecalibacillus intestinalis TaxID=1982626 RepID=UPI002E7A671D|nr:helix-turn-helix domain-containing protein [Faecalibacillus intestinalis]MED9807940.1 helix-turn-helix domain-containing protein [Faecalibacillus intestinalis]